MPRRARLVIPEFPLHITQRGVNRCAIFLDIDDRKHYLSLLRSTTKHHDIDVHAYVLTGNHVHLLVTTHNVESLAATPALPWAVICSSF